MYGTPELKLKSRIALADIYSLFVEFNPGEHIHSPFKNRTGGDDNDSTPSLVIDEFNEHLYWKDFGLNKENVLGKNDAIGFVRQLKGFDSRNKTCLYILKLLDDGETPVKYEFEGRQVNKAVFEVKTNDFWQPWELEYWAKYGASKEDLEFMNIKPLKWYVSNGYVIWRSQQFEPKFKYGFGKNSWQLYNPLALDKTKRFKTYGISDVIIGWDQLPKVNEGVLITKSMKDLLVWKAFGARAVIAPMNELTYEPLLAKKEELEKRFGKVFISFDSDDVGKHNELLLHEKTNWNTLFLEYPDDIKDPAELLDCYGTKQGLKMLKTILHEGLRNITN